MKLFAILFLFAAVVSVECLHTFLGTNIGRPMVYHHDMHYSSRFYQKRVEDLRYSMPINPLNRGRIQGILAYDLTYSGATANVTLGGLGYTFVHLRMQSDMGKPLHYDVYIYA